MDKLIIETENLRKTFKSRARGNNKDKSNSEVEAVRGISFSVYRGEIFGLLGPNGAGKTTTMRMLCTLLEPTSGNAEITGCSLVENQADIRRRIGYVSQVGGMQRESTGRENLMLQARLYGVDKSEASARVEELLDLLDIRNFADRRTVTYSGGQRRIFDLAAGIVHRPELLFLDEPSTGLDPQNRAHVWEQVKKLHKQGTTVFLTTHYLDEADALCSRVAIVDRGTLVSIGTPAELKRQISGDILVLGAENEKMAKKAFDMIERNAFIREKHLKESTVYLHVDKGDENLPVILKELHEKNILIKNIELSRPTLDDVFLKLTGRSLRENEG